MIDVNQLTSLISAFRVETEKSASKRAQGHACMSIAESEQIILHSRDIRKCQNGFEILFDLDVKRRFYEAINNILGQKDLYVIVACSILKEPYIRQFGRFNDVYGQSLSFILERAIFYVDNLDDNNEPCIETVVERRGKREDRSLLHYYQQLLDKGTYWVTSERMKSHLSQLSFRWKSEDVVGLQVADLIAYPLTRHVLNPESVNLPYSVFEQNIFKEGNKMMGLKIYPQE